MNYSELITLGVVIFCIAPNTKCYNSKCNKPKVFISLDSLIGVGDAEMEKKDNTFN